MKTYIMKAFFIMSLVIPLLCCPRIPNLYIDGYENCLTHNKPRWIFYLRSFEVFEKILPPSSHHPIEVPSLVRNKSINPSIVLALVIILDINVN